MGMGAGHPLYERGKITPRQITQVDTKGNENPIIIDALTLTEREAALLKLA